MCFKQNLPAVQQPAPLATPTSESVRRREDQERTLRARMAGIRNDVVTTPLGIPATTILGV